MKNILLGVIIGLFLAGILYFYFNPNPMLRIDVGRMLDKDEIYLKSGSIMRCWIIDKDDEQVWIEHEKGYFTLPRSRCQFIKENALLQYLRKLI